jgi:hypothetical protein
VPFAFPLLDDPMCNSNCDTMSTKIVTVGVTIFWGAKKAPAGA